MIDIDNIDGAIARLAARNNLTLEDASEAFWIIGDMPFVDAEGRSEVDPILRPGKRKVKLAWSRAWM